MNDISKITEYLYVSSRVGHEHADALKLHKFDLIISMIGQEKPHEIFTMPPFKTLWLRTYDTFLTPVPVTKLSQGVEAALPLIKNGGKVLVFCREGKRRSITMASAILIAMGISSDDAAKLLKQSRAVADPTRFYVRWRIKQFERFWKAKQEVAHP